MRVEHLFHIYTKLYMPPHHFEFYASFFFYALVTCSVLWWVVYVIFSCGKHIHKRPCRSVSLSVRPSVPAFASTFHHRLPWYFIIWLETPTACGSQIYKVIWQISGSHRQIKNSETGQIKGFRAFSGERMREGPEIPYADVSWPPPVCRGWLYVFVPVRTPPLPADSCSCDNFWTTFWILSAFGTGSGPEL